MASFAIQSAVSAERPELSEMTEDFLVFCQKLWRRWLADTLEVPCFVRSTFDLDAAPEPYIYFGAGAKPLVALTTNPGRPMPFQRRAKVQAGTGPLSATNHYATAARKLGPFYEEKLANRPAGRRIAALRTLSYLVGYKGVLQVEACPFHSRSLPRKGTLRQTIREGGLLGRYAEALKAFLRRRPVVILSAVSSRVSLGPRAAALSEWHEWNAEIAGLVLKRAKFVRLVAKGSKTTCAALVSFEEGIPKALVLMMGGNNLPAGKGLCALADALRV
jgi:hypothetical protein